MDKRFETLEHTADIGIRAFGHDRRSLYENAAYGLLSFLVDPATVRRAKVEHVRIEGADPVDLLVAWLHEILFRFDAEGRAYCKATVQAIDETSLTASLHGEAFDPQRHEPVEGIKAVTYHGARVERRGDGWVAEVLFDV